MEEISKIVSPKISPQINESSVTQKIKSKPLKLNFLQYFFIYATTIFLTIIVIYFVWICNFAFDLTSRQKENNNQKINPINIPTQIIQETIPTEIEEEDNQNKDGQGNIDTKNTYKAVSIQDDKNSVSKLVLIDQDNNETVIDESKYWQMADQTLKPSHGDFIFSLDNNFLYYNRYSGYEEASSFLYDLTKKKVLQLNFFSETKGFTSDSKYFYACSEAGMNGGGAIMRDLILSNNIYAPNDEGDDSYNCQYDKSIGEVTFSKLYHSTEDADKTPSQYKFSQRTGVLTKIK